MLQSSSTCSLGKQAYLLQWGGQPQAGSPNLRNTIRAL